MRSDPPTDTASSSTTSSSTTTTYFDQDNLFLEHLNRGFAYLRAGAAAAETGGLTDTTITYDSGVPKCLSKVSVHFMDPTSSAASGRIQSPQAAAHGPPKSLELYQQMTRILSRDYQNTLRHVSYNSTTGGPAVIPALVVQPTVTHGGILLQDTEDDAAEWHMNPMTHVYLAECHSLEHYRQKVKPSIQIVVSQLVQAVTAAAVVNKNHDNIHQHHQQQQQPPPFLIVVVPCTPPSNSDTAVSDDASVVSLSMDGTTQTTTAPKSRVAAFASRMAAARNRISGNATTAEESGAASSDDELDTVLESSRQQRSTTTTTKFERELVRRMTADFTSARVCAMPSFAKDKDNDNETPLHEWEPFLLALGATIVDNFQEKCRCYQQELQTVAAQRLIANNHSTDDDLDRQYYLLKESMAFTYEQCHLYAEALLQYEELRAMIPGMDKQSNNTMEFNNNSSAAVSSLQTALHGDAIAFRQQVRMAPSLAAVAYEMEYYLLVRETTQLFALQKPEAVLERCLVFARKLWQFHETKADTTQKSMAINKWGLEFGWVVKEATYLYTGKRNLDDSAFSTTLCELMGFTRLRLLKMGKLLEIPVTPNRGGQEFPHDLKTAAEWKPWTEPTHASPEDPEEESLRTNANIVAEALSTKEGFEWMYMSLTKSLAANQEASGRKRLASCLRLEAIDIAIKQNRLRTAAQELSKVAKECENWKSCHFFLLFRLCQLQRQFEPGNKYLGTLVCCFAAPHAPPQAREIFDMNAAKGTERNLFKRVYAIGDTVNVNISVTSQLPEEIQLDFISVSLVPFRSYVAAMEDNEEVKESETFSELQLRDVIVKPGINQFRYVWVPNHSGQFILSSVSMSWKNVTFTYNAKERKRPTIRVDVIPCEHSQKLTLAPDYLIPGHTQNLLLEFKTGKDTLVQGKLQLVGSPGILVGKQDSNTLLSTLELDLESHSADSSISLPIKIQCSGNGAGGLLNVQAKTRFCRDGGEEFDAQLDTTVTALGQTGFVLADKNLIPYQSDLLMLYAAFDCHSPKSFFLKGWKLDLPAYLELASDLNETLANTDLSYGETILLNFECRVTGHVPDMVKTTVVLIFDNKEGMIFEESHVLRQDRPIMPLPLAEMQPVSVKLSPSATHGIVGYPIQIRCTIDASALSGQEVGYTVSSDAIDWIISGKTRGPLPENAELQFVAIPTRPGTLSSYLKLSLQNNDLEIPISVSQPGPFHSSDPLQHSAVAFPLTRPDCSVM